MNIKNIFSAYFLIAIIVGIVMNIGTPSPSGYISENFAYAYMAIMAVPFLSGIIAGCMKSYDRWRFPLGMFNTAFSGPVLIFYSMTHFFGTSKITITVWEFWNIPLILHCMSATIWTVFALATAEWMKRFGRIFREFISTRVYKSLSCGGLIVLGCMILFVRMTLGNMVLHPGIERVLFGFLAIIPFFWSTTILYPVLTRESGVRSIPFGIILFNSSFEVMGALTNKETSLFSLGLLYVLSGVLCLYFTQSKPEADNTEMA